jgi:glycosyltransferase involved in cell wall biosynthesis
LDNKILAISNHGDLVGGGEHSFLDLIANLTPIWKPIAVFPHQGELTQWCLQRNINHRIINLHQLKPQFFHKNLKSLIAFIRLIRHEKPNIIYANGSRAAFYGGLAGRLCSTPVVWHCRITEKDPYLDFILLHMNNRIIVNSQATAARFDLNFRSKIRVVHNGVDVIRLSEKTVPTPVMIDEKWKVILTVARVSRQKRHDLILSAFEAVAKRDPALHLVCIGAMDQFEMDWWRHLQKRSAQSLAADRIHWISQVDDVRPWYQAASVMVLASDNESFGRVIVEAMASGVPVIANRSGGIPEIIRNGQDGLLVTPGNYKEIENAITKIMDDELLRSYLVESARKRVKLFDLGRHIQKMIEIFEETARQKSCKWFVEPD